MPRLIPAFVLAVGLAAGATAQPRPVQIRMDTGTFRYSADASLAEVYLSVGAASLAYTRSASGAFEAVLPVRLTVRPAASAAPQGAALAPAYEETLQFQFSVADTSALQPGQVFTEQIRTALAPGEYEVEASVAGGSASAAVGARKDLVVPDYSAATGPAISSLQLARRIVRAQSATDPFVKSGMVVQPYPDAYFGGDLRRVTYYAEVYAPPADAATYTLLAFLSDSSRPTPVEGTQSRTTRAVQPVDVVLGAIDIAALPTGEYTLHLAVLNASNEAVAEQSKRLYVINPDVAQPTRNVAVAEDDEILYQAMGEGELALNIDHVRVIATSSERTALNALRSDEERRNYLVRFWRDRDAAGGGSARQTFYSRLPRVNDQYRQGSRPGYKSDRGRVLLVYGPPSGIDRQSFNADTAPFEVWSYENIPSEGFSEFVFVDQFNSGEMTLIHSTVTGEVTRPDWREEILND